MRKGDSLPIGVAIGACAPLIILVLILVGILTQIDGGVKGLIHIMRGEGTIGRLLSLATLADAILFFIAIYTHRLRMAKGVLGATFIWAITAMACAVWV